MTDTLATMEFSATARVDTRLTIANWPAFPGPDLVEAVERIATFEVANEAPAVVEDGDTNHLAWRGYLTGGLATLYEVLGAVLAEHGLGAFYADPRLEVFVPSDGDVVVLGALRVPIRLSRSEWDRRVAVAQDGNELAADLIRGTLSDRASGVVEQARRDASENPHPLVAARPAAFETTAPGEVNFDLLDDSDCQLTERYDPEDNLDEAWLSCSVLRWRTDFIAPGTVMPPSQRLADCTGWRVTQWEWVEDDEEEDVDDDGRWALRAHVPMPAAAVAERVPRPLRPWVRRMTEEGVAWLDDLADAEPQFASDAERLRDELEALR